MSKAIHYTGDPETGYPSLRGVPARDLDPDDIARLAYRWGVSITKARARLIASGHYTEPQRAARAEVPADE